MGVRQDPASSGEAAPTPKAHKVTITSVVIYYVQGMPGPLGELRTVYEDAVDGPDEAIALIAKFNSLYPGQATATGLVTASAIPPMGPRN